MGSPPPSVPHADSPGTGSTLRAHISIRINLIDDSDVISDSVLITCPPSGISQYVRDAWLPFGPLHHLLSTREAEAVTLATAFSDVPPAPTDPFPFWEACGYNNDGLPFTSRAERLPGVVPRRTEYFGIAATAFAVPVPQSTLSRVSSWVQSQSSLGTRVLVQVQYPMVHNRLYTLLPGDRIDPPPLATEHQEHLQCQHHLQPGPWILGQARLLPYW